MTISDYRAQAWVMGDLRSGEEQEDSDVFFDAGDSAVVGDRLALRTIGERPEWGGKEDDPSCPLLRKQRRPWQAERSQEKANAVNFSRARYLRTRPTS